MRFDTQESQVSEFSAAMSSVATIRNCSILFHQILSSPRIQSRTISRAHGLLYNVALHNAIARWKCCKLFILKCQKALMSGINERCVLLTKLHRRVVALMPIARRSPPRVRKRFLKIRRGHRESIGSRCVLRNAHGIRRCGKNSEIPRYGD